MLNFEDFTVYKIDYSHVDGKPEVLFMSLKKLVGERGFEPPTSWSRLADNPLGIHKRYGVYRELAGLAKRSRTMALLKNPFF
jgi:hypothetical protein